MLGLRMSRSSHACSRDVFINGAPVKGIHFSHLAPELGERKKTQKPKRTLDADQFENGVVFLF